MVKVKKEKRDSEAPEDGEQEEQSWEEKTMYLSPVARPLASKKLTKRLYKTMKKGKSSLFVSTARG
jgi:H/ACA ribonucleoprotein complex subunit 2